MAQEKNGLTFTKRLLVEDGEFCFSWCARQGADLGGERPSQARSGELLALLAAPALALTSSCLKHSATELVLKSDIVASV
jgi:hypothetical protein